MSPTFAGKRRRIRLGTSTFITAIPHPTSTVPGNRPPPGHAARTMTPPSRTTSTSSSPRSSPSRARSAGAASAASPKHTTGTVARIDWPADDSPRSGSTGGISPIAVRMLNATMTTPRTASADTASAACGGRPRVGPPAGVVVLMDGREGRRRRPSPSCRPRPGSGRDAGRLQGRLDRAIPLRRDLARRRALLDEDRLDRAHHVGVVRPLRHPEQLLVAADLEELERVRERGKLARRVGLRGEEPAPVERAEAHRPVLDRVARAAVRLEERVDQFRVLARFAEVLVVELGEDRVAGDLLTLRQQLDRLVLDRVRVGEVLEQLLCEVVRVLLAQRRLDGRVGAVLDALGHRGLLVADLLGDGGGLLVAGAPRDAQQELVGGVLEVLVGERVGAELARRVGLAAGEEDEPLAADRHDGVLELGGRRAMRVQALADEALVALGLRQVRPEGVGEAGVAGEVGRRAHLRDRLLLDGVRVGQVLDELVVDRAKGHGWALPTAARRRRAAVRALPSVATMAAPSDTNIPDAETLARRAAALEHVRLWGDPVLRTAARPVERFDAAVVDQAARMARLMDEALGAGLAANQVGLLNRLLVYRVAPDAPLRVLVNPQIEWASEDEERFAEGCLSLPGVWVEVPRPARVRVVARDEHGGRLVVDAEGREASVVQHEIDHLDGVLVLDRLPADERKAAVRRLREAIEHRT